VQMCFISQVCIKLVALCINRYQEVALSFEDVGNPCSTQTKSHTDATGYQAKLIKIRK